jgi:hypothetical protein
MCWLTPSSNFIPSAQVTIGPVIENGFYYDFAFERPFTPDDLGAIERAWRNRPGAIPISRSVMGPRGRSDRLFPRHRRGVQGQIIADIPRSGSCRCTGRTTSSISAVARMCPAPASSRPSS